MPDTAFQITDDFRRRMAGVFGERGGVAGWRGCRSCWPSARALVADVGAALCAYLQLCRAGHPRRWHAGRAEGGLSEPGTALGDGRRCNCWPGRASVRCWTPMPSAARSCWSACCRAGRWQHWSQTKTSAPRPSPSTCCAPLAARRRRAHLPQRRRLGAGLAPPARALRWRHRAAAGATASLKQRSASPGCWRQPALQVLLHGDLHHDNILSATRAPWLIIDAKGLVGDSGYDLGAFLYNPIPDLLTLPQPEPCWRDAWRS